MALQYEGNTSLAFDTTVMRNYANKYGQIATDLTQMASDLDACLATLESTGWTTPAGSAFHKMTETDWKQNIEKYADLLKTLKKILNESANKYDALVDNHIHRTKAK